MKIWFVIIVVLVTSNFAHAGLDNQLENAIVYGDWRAVKELAHRQNRQSQIGVESVVLGYASLFAGDYETAMVGFAQASHRKNVDIASSVSIVERIAYHYPTSWTGYLLKADALARAERYSEALEAITKAIKLNSNEAIVYHVRGLIYALAGYNDSALDDFNHAILINPKLADAYVARGIIHLREDKPNKAQRDFEEALRLVSDFAIAANARGVALCQQGRYEEALQSFIFALDLEPNFIQAALNIKAAKLLSAPDRARTRIAIVAGQRAGVLGRHTVAVVISERNRVEEVATAAATTMRGVTGLTPLVTDNSNEATQELTSGRGPVVLVVTLPKTDVFDLGVADVFREISQKASDNTDIRVITDGLAATQTTSKALKEHIASANNAQPQVKSWDIVDSSGKAEKIDIKNLAQTALYLRSLGVEVRMYVHSNKDLIREWAALTPAEKVGLSLVVVPPSSPFEMKGFITQLVPQIAASWTARPEQNQHGAIRPCFYSTPEGEPGIFIPSLPPPIPSPSGASMPGGNNLWIGTSRIRTPQIILTNPNGEILIIRFDIDNPHGQKPHINIEGSSKNIHTDKDGIELSKDDDVIVRISKGTAVIEVNGEKVEEYEVKEVDSEEEIVVERKPTGKITVTTVMKDGEVAGEVKEMEDEVLVVQVGDKLIEIPLPIKEGQNKGENDEGQNEEEDKDKNKHDKGMSPMVIVAGPSGQIILPGPTDGSLEPSDKELPIVVPPGHIIVPGPCGPIVIPDPNKPLTYPAPTSDRPFDAFKDDDGRGGVYTVDDTNLEIVSAKQAGTDLLFDKSSGSARDAEALLQCPFLIFQETLTSTKAKE
jgi:tetratricopeptide (TPR) repeat protein